MDAAVMPLPRPETTPPVTKMCLAMPPRPSSCQSPPQTGGRPPPVAGRAPARRLRHGTTTPLRIREGFCGGRVLPVAR